jgi:hypothetical protein
MKKRVGLLLFLLSCEPPAALIFELNFNEDVLNSPIKPTELVINFCATATGCQRVIDFDRQVVTLSGALKTTETIAFTPGNVLAPQEVFFEFALVGENAAKEKEVIASGSTTQTTKSASYLKREKILLGLLPGTALQSAKDRTLDLGTRVTLPNLRVSGIGSSNTVAFAQAAPLNQFPAHPFFSGLTLKGNAAQLGPLLPNDCRTLNGKLAEGDDNEIELQVDTLTPSNGCGNNDALTVSLNELQINNEPQPLDGVLLRADEVFIDTCSFNPNVFCAIDFDGFETEVSNFIFDPNTGNFNNTLTTFRDNFDIVTIVGVGELFQGRLLLLPRNIGDLIP